MNKSSSDLMGSSSNLTAIKEDSTSLIRTKSSKDLSNDTNSNDKKSSQTIKTSSTITTTPKERRPTGTKTSTSSIDLGTSSDLKKSTDIPKTNEESSENESQLRREIRELTRANIQLKQDKEKAEEDNERTKKELEKISNNLDSEKSRNNDLKSEIEKLENKSQSSSSNEREISDLKRELEKLNKENEELRNENSNIKKESLSIKKESSQSLDDKQLLEKKVDLLTKENQSLHKENEELNQSNMDMDNDISKLRKELENAKSESRNKSSTNLTSVSSISSEEVENLKQEVEDLKKKLDTENKNTEKITETSKRHEKNYGIVKKKLTNAESNLIEANNRIEKLSEEVESLREYQKKNLVLEGEILDLNKKIEELTKGGGSSSIRPRPSKTDITNSSNNLKSLSTSSTTNLNINTENEKKIKEMEEENKKLKNEITRLKLQPSTPPPTSSNRTMANVLREPTSEKLVSKHTTSRPSRYNKKNTTKTLDDGDKDEVDEDSSTPKYKIETTGIPALDLLREITSGQRKSVPTLLSNEIRLGKLKQRLIILKGRKRVRAVRVELSASSLSCSDVFLLETDSFIIQWDGKDSSRVKKARAVDLISRMNRLRGQRFAATVVQLEQPNDKGEGNDDDEKFWGPLGGKPSGGITNKGEDDEKWEELVEDKTFLVKIKENSETEIVLNKKRESLESDGCYLLDCGEEVYLWTGKKTSMDYRKKALVQSEKMLKASTRPQWVQVEKMNEGGEDPLFAEKFTEWPDSFHQVLGKNMGLTLSNVSQKNEQTRPSAKTLFEGTPREIEELTTDLKGTLRIQRISGFKLKEIDESQYPLFYCGECSVLLYEYNENAVIYYWQGTNASVKDKGTSGQLAKDLNQTINGKAKLIRVEQGYEPKHMLSLLKGEMIVYKGKESEALEQKTLFQMRGTEDGDTRTVECWLVSASSLNSLDIFFLKNSSTLYIWYGKKANLRSKAERVAKKLFENPKIVSVEEGKETSEFWDVIGGKEEYSHINDEERIRFWVCENVNKTYKCYENSRFNQFELHDNRQIILDRFTEVLVWCGQDTSNEDRRIATEIAMEYVEKSARPYGDTRDPKTCKVININQGDEPLNFTHYFQAWKPFEITLEKRRKNEMHSKKTGTAVLSYFGKTYSYQVLSNKDDLPEGVDPAKLEEYLDEGDFPEAFGMTKDEYLKQPKWKQMELKKKTKIF
eukprot:TRINITY_DN1423_c0_g1_i4.p1 TRINITY_DN1423_c0_g1~~TRINITY_DN1423_c0_g1_i4.p1  ORF type:complete len:1316 (+),score=543.79 TRINITY_DN1423_c0_g1_i4:356-3949(+)